jgi:hypothetical protein
MPRFALVLLLVLPACSFDADYSHARLRCTDNVCPSGLSCINQECTAPPDASVGVDASHDASHDAAPMHADTCNDPGTAMATQPGTTVGHVDQVSAMCGGVIYNGPDAVYQITGPRQVTIGISGSYAVAAYVISPPCTVAPTCETNMAAQPAAPLTISLSAGTHLIVVDGVNASLSGTYTLTVQ